MGVYYAQGNLGLPQDHEKALELYHKAGELGNFDAYHNIGNAYKFGRGVEIDEKMAAHYYELAAMGGNVYARFNLGLNEANFGSTDRALKHWIVSVKDGHSTSLENIKRMLGYGDATKDDYAKALRSYQAHLDEIKSDQRDEAAAFDDDYKYY